MTREEILTRPIRGIHPFDELPIDATVWRQAHDYHVLHRHLHDAAIHRPGIVWGLEVFPSSTREATVVVAPGVAIDPWGRVIVLREALSFELARGGQHFWSLTFQTSWEPGTEIEIGGGSQSFGFEDGREVFVSSEAPGADGLELARLNRSNERAAIKRTANPYDPGKDEINTLYRRLAFPHCFADAGIGEVSYVPGDRSLDWKPNRAGLWHLLREGNSRGFHLHFTGTYRREQNPSLLYMAGRNEWSLDHEAIEEITGFIAGGGVLLGEAIEGNAGFVKAFRALAGQLETKLEHLKPTHPLFTSHGVFAAPPPGANSDGELWGDSNGGVLLSTFDWGGAWQGRFDDPKNGGREQIRGAVEFGLNIVAYASQRKREQDLAGY